MVALEVAAVDMGSQTIVKVSKAGWMDRRIRDLRGMWEVVVGSCPDNEVDRTAHEEVGAIRCC